MAQGESHVDPRDLRLEQIAAMVTECRDTLNRLIGAGTGHVDLLVQIHLLTTDLVETQRQLRLAKGAAA